MWNDEQYESDEMSVEAQVARNMGDNDWEDLADETPKWRVGGTKAKSNEKQTIKWSPTETRGYDKEH